MEPNAFYDANAIYDGGFNALKSSKFKYATQTYEMNHLLFTAQIKESMENGTYRPTEGRKFLSTGRGKKRYIASNTMTDKVVNHVLSDEVLMPAIKKYLIYDNGACQKGKGVDFYRRRFVYHLRNYFHKHGSNQGYILLGDFSGYYANIRHSECLKVVNRFLMREDPSEEERKVTLRILYHMFQLLKVDVSRFSDEEIYNLYYGKCDPMLNHKVPKELLTGEKFLAKGLDIGNQNSQAIGLIYAHKIDNYVKIVRGVKGYGRYTDDFYAISPSKAFLADVLAGIRKIADECGLILNHKKTRILKLSELFHHLQFAYALTETGRVIQKISRQNIINERLRLKAYKRLLENNRLALKEIDDIFKGWMGGYYKYMSRLQISKMSELYIELFGRLPKWKKGHGRVSWLLNHPKTI